MIYEAAAAGLLRPLRRHKRLFYAQHEVEALVRQRLRNSRNAQAREIVNAPSNRGYVYSITEQVEIEGDLAA